MRQTAYPVIRERAWTMMARKEAERLVNVLRDEIREGKKAIARERQKSR